MRKVLVIIFLLISTNIFAAENQKLNFTVEKFEDAKKNGETVVVAAWNKYCGTCIKQKVVLDQAEKALDALANGTKFIPDNLDLKLALLEQILKMGTTRAEIEQAKLVLAKGEKIAPNNPQILFFKGHLAQLSGETEGAREAWKKLQDILDPESEAAKALKVEIEKLPKAKK